MEGTTPVSVLWPQARVLSGRRRATLGAIAVVAGLGFAAHLLRDGLGVPLGGTRWVAPDTLHDGLEVLAGLACLARAAWVRRDRRAWLLIGLAVTAYAIGDTLWFAWLGRLASPPFPSIADGFWLSFYVLVIVALAPLARAHVRRSQGALWLDAVVGGLVVAAAGITVLYRDGLGIADGSRAAAAVNLAYPVLDVSLVAAVVALFALTGWRPGRMWALLGAGAGLLGAADTAFVYVSAGSAVNIGVLRPMYVLSLLLLALAAWQEPGEVHAVDLERARVLIVPSAFALMGAGVLGLASFTHVPKLAVVFSFAALVGVMLRGWVTFGEVRALSHTREQAVTDELTGLGNRRLLYQRVEREIASATPATRLALLLVDLDRFKDLNDALGHHVGDTLLAQLGARLTDAVRPGDLLVRLGGDEFAVLVSDPTGAATTAAVAGEIHAALDEPFILDDIPVQIDASIGGALYPEHGDELSTLLRHADVAMYHAKMNHTGFELYEEMANSDSRARLVVVGELRGALTRGELVVYYQPKASMATGRITGAEALVRWQHPTRGLLPPGAFLPAAEQTAVMRLVTKFVLGRALTDCGRWHARGDALSVAVNLATLDLMDPELPGEVAALLAEHRVPAGKLRLEVTENVVTADPTRTSEVLDLLAAQGVQIALDDFGTGYSSLARLARQAVSELKIDRSFVTGMTTNPENATIVRSTIDLARNLDLLVVAEGVEHEEEWEQLAAYGCHEAQGYLLSPPVPCEQFEQLVRDDVRRAA